MLQRAMAAALAAALNLALGSDTGKGQASRVPLSSADRYIRDIYRLAVQSVAEMGLQGGFTGL